MSIFSKLFRLEKPEEESIPENSNLLVKGADYVQNQVDTVAEKTEFSLFNSTFSFFKNMISSVGSIITSPFKAIGYLCDGEFKRAAKTGKTWVQNAVTVGAHINPAVTSAIEAYEIGEATYTAVKAAKEAAARKYDIASTPNKDETTKESENGTTNDPNSLTAAPVPPGSIRAAYNQTDSKNGQQSDASVLVQQASARAMS